MRRRGVGGLTARGWRQVERCARAAHERDTLSDARGLEGLLDAIVEPSLAGVLLLRGATRQLGLAGTVAAAPLHGAECRLLAAGRYGRSWWIRLLVEDRTVTVLGSQLRISRYGGGAHEAPLDSPAGGESILVPCKLGSPSATSPG